MRKYLGGLLLLSALPFHFPDALGDPLPEGAIARLGTLRFKHPSTISIDDPEGNEVVLTDQELKNLWSGLADANAEKAFQCLARLVAAPKSTLPFFQEQLKPVPPVLGERLQQLVKDLNDAKFAVRQKATAELEKAGLLARSTLEKQLTLKPTLEMRQRVEALLKKLDGPVTRPEELQGLRAVEVLEHLGTPAARKVLETVASGAGEALLTQAAQEALERLKKLGKMGL